MLFLLRSTVFSLALNVQLDTLRFLTADHVQERARQKSMYEAHVLSSGILAQQPSYGQPPTAGYGSSYYPSYGFPGSPQPQPFVYAASPEAAAAAAPVAAAPVAPLRSSEQQLQQHTQL